MRDQVRILSFLEHHEPELNDFYTYSLSTELFSPRDTIGKGNSTNYYNYLSILRSLVQSEDADFNTDEELIAEQELHELIKKVADMKREESKHRKRKQETGTDDEQGRQETESQIEESLRKKKKRRLLPSSLLFSVTMLARVLPRLIATEEAIVVSGLLSQVLAFPASCLSADSDRHRRSPIFNFLSAASQSSPETAFSTFERLPLLTSFFSAFKQLEAQSAQDWSDLLDESICSDLSFFIDEKKKIVKEVSSPFDQCREHPSLFVRFRFLSLALFFYLNSIKQNYHSPHYQMTTETRASSGESDVQTLVVGGGPVGLANALTAFQCGAKVRLVESRVDYTRNVWFDIYPQPWSTSIDFLKESGIHYQIIEYEIQGDDVITIRAQVLEKLLAKAVLITGIKIHYGYQFSDLTLNGHRRREALVSPSEHLRRISGADNHSAPHHVMRLDFDVLIGADGPSSLVRSVAGMSSELQNKFFFADMRAPRQVPDLHQPTMIVGFKPDESTANRCPSVRRVNGELIDPRYPGLLLSYVSNVFKRFYHGHCHMQILWTREKGQRITEQWRGRDSEQGREDARIPWQELLEVSRVVFDQPIGSVEALKEMIERTEENDDSYDIELVNVEIYAAFDSSRRLGESEDDSSGDQFAILVGDALYSAHYRLGIGINSGFSALAEMKAFLSGLVAARLGTASGSPSHRLLIDEKNERSNDRLSSLVQYQLSVMFYETYCDYIIIFDTSASDIYSTPVVYGKDRTVRSDDEEIDWYRIGPYNPQEIIENCLYDTERERSELFETELSFDKALADVMKLK